MTKGKPGMESLDKLPLPMLIAFGLGLAIIYGVRYLGLMSGERATPSASASSAQVAAVIVDPSALNKATAAIEALNITFMEMNRVARDMVQSQQNLADEIDRVREEMRVQREVNRR